MDLICPGRETQAQSPCQEMKPRQNEGMIARMVHLSSIEKLQKQKGQIVGNGIKHSL